MLFSMNYDTIIFNTYRQSGNKIFMNFNTRSALNIITYSKFSRIFI